MARTQAASPDDERWKAVLARSRDADGDFVYAVRSTGVYCRPTCPSRRPLRRNVTFYGTPAAARDAGFRACLRCTPEDGARDAREDRITALCRVLESAEKTPRLEALATEAGLSRFHLLREFKRVTGVTPAAYYRFVRARRLGGALGDGSAVDDAIYAAGFGSPSRVYERSRELLGMTPAVARRGAPGETVRYGFSRTPFGLMLVAAAAAGVCAIEFGTSRAELLSLLERRFPKAVRVSADRELERWLAAVSAHLAEPASVLDLPLDVRGTVFQKQVWDALRRIPAGTTVTYRDLARSLGRPDAVRAVASACAANALAMAIPCHRVVGSDGGLHGYRWGVERKRALLDHEGRQAPKPKR